MSVEGESNGKQWQIDRLESEVTKIHEKLDTLITHQQSHQLNLATYIAGRASTCPNRPELDKEIKDMCDRFDIRLNRIDVNIAKLCAELDKKANKEEMERQIGDKADKKDIVRRSEIKLLWMVVSSAVLLMGGVISIVAFFLSR